jgi:hypothetical protein
VVDISLAVLLKIRMADFPKEAGRGKTAFFHQHSLKGALWPRGKPIPSMPRAHGYLQATSVETLGWDSNNWIYLVSIGEASATPSRNPGTAFLQGSTKQVVVRLSNPDAQLNHGIRVQNEVAAIFLMRGALLNYDSSLIPEGYNWNSASEGMAG